MEHYFLFKMTMSGVVGKVGTILGENGINIGAYLLSQDYNQKLAFAVIRLDYPIEHELISKLEDIDEPKFVNQIQINIDYLLK